MVANNGQYLLPSGSLWCLQTWLAAGKSSWPSHGWPNFALKQHIATPIEAARLGLQNGSTWITIAYFFRLLDFLGRNMQKRGMLWANWANKLLDDLYSESLLNNWVWINQWIYKTSVDQIFKAFRPHMWVHVRWGSHIFRMFLNLIGTAWLVNGYDSPRQSLTNAGMWTLLIFFFRVFVGDTRVRATSTTIDWNMRENQSLPNLWSQSSG